MRESRQSGSEGGGAGSNRLSLPLSIIVSLRDKMCRDGSPLPSCMLHDPGKLHGNLGRELRVGQKNSLVRSHRLAVGAEIEPFHENGRKVLANHLVIAGLIFHELQGGQDFVGRKGQVGGVGCAITTPAPSRIQCARSMAATSAGVSIRTDAGHWPTRVEGRKQIGTVSDHGHAEGLENLRRVDDIGHASLAALTTATGVSINSMRSDDTSDGRVSAEYRGCAADRAGHQQRYAGSRRQVHTRRNRGAGIKPFDDRPGQIAACGPLRRPSLTIASSSSGSKPTVKRPLANGDDRQRHARLLGGASHVADRMHAGRHGKRVRERDSKSDTARPVVPWPRR